jgi:ribosomal subunit interface protein
MQNHQEGTTMARIPLQITSRNFELTGEIENFILKKSEKLDKFHREMTSCRVLLEVPHRNRKSGLVYNARIDLALPGKELVIRREAHEDLHRAINLAFEAALKRVQAYARRKRGEVKRHEEPPRGRVASLFADQGYGFITAADGRDVYFHRNSVRNERFEDMEVGMEVVFVEEQGLRGPQASTVRIR